jgi:hypothetical protein
MGLLSQDNCCCLPVDVLRLLSSWNKGEELLYFLDHMLEYLLTLFESKGRYTLSVKLSDFNM